MSWPIFGFMSVVPDSELREDADLQTRIAHLETMFHQAVGMSRIQYKVIASRMWLSQPHLSRQANEHGLNLARLSNAGREFWLHLIRPFVYFVGLTDADMQRIFGSETDEDRDERERQQDERIAKLERLVKRLIEDQPEPAKDAKRVA